MIEDTAPAFATQVNFGEFLGSVGDDDKASTRRRVDARAHIARVDLNAQRSFR
jgi:hypothetical protein